MHFKKENSRHTLLTEVQNKKNQIYTNIKSILLNRCLAFYKGFVCVCVIYLDNNFLQWASDIFQFTRNFPETPIFTWLGSDHMMQKFNPILDYWNSPARTAAGPRMKLNRWGKLSASLWVKWMFLAILGTLTSFSWFILFLTWYNFCLLGSNFVL